MTADAAGRHHVVAAMLVRDGAILLCQRSARRAWYPGVWDLPGGHVEQNETTTDALARELREELGVVFSEPLGDPLFSMVTDEFEMRVWVVRRWDGPPSNCAPEEHDEVTWFETAEVPPLRLADDAYRPWIADILAGPGDAS